MLQAAAISHILGQSITFSTCIYMMSGFYLIYRLLDTSGVRIIKAMTMDFNSLDIDSLESIIMSKMYKESKMPLYRNTLQA